MCSLDVAFTVGTVRNRLREDNTAVPMGSFAKVVLFGGLRRVVVSFRMAGVVLPDIQTCSRNCRKLLQTYLRGRRNTLATLSKDVGQFSCQPQPFGRVHRHFSWQERHFRRVFLLVFCTSHWQGYLRPVATRCKFRGRRGILCHVLKIDGSLARNINFQVANF